MTFNIKISTLILILLVIPTFISLVRPGFFPMQDDLQAFRLHQMDKCFADFQIPCRWVPDMGYQYGYPQFNFYSPGVYYIGEIFHLIGIQFIDTVKILFALGFILSALAMFLFLRSLFGNFPAIVGSLLYSYAPFKAAQVYVRGSLSEFWAFVFFPLILWSIYQLIKTGQIKYKIFLALSLGGLLLTHNLLSLLFLPVAIIWALTWLYLEKKWQISWKVVIGMLLGFGLAAFFVLPVIFEKQFVHIETLLSGYFDYRQHFVSLYQLFISNYFGYGSSVFGTGDEVTLSTGPIHWIVGLLGVILALFNWKAHRKIAVSIIVVATVELVVLFLMHQRSSFIWSSISGMAFLQFPWRFLSISVFLLSFLGAAAIFLLEEKWKKVAIPAGVLVIVLVFILHSMNFKPASWLNISDKEKFSGQSWEKQLTISIFDYLPIYAKLPPNHEAPKIPEILGEGYISINDFKKGSDFQKFHANVGSETTLRLPLFDFPGMKVIATKTGGIMGGSQSIIGREEIPHYNNDCREQEYCLGLITFKLPPGDYEMEAKLTNTPVRTIGNTLTLLSGLALLAIGLKSKYVKRH